MRLGRTKNTPSTRSGTPTPPRSPLATLPPPPLSSPLSTPLSLSLSLSLRLSPSLLPPRLLPTLL